MREIKFRGFAVERMIKSQWLYGFGVDYVEYAEHYAKELGRDKDFYLYTDSGTYQVNEQSIGQYTGLKDKHGKEIYEGDIILSRYGQIGYVHWDKEQMTYLVYWFKGKGVTKHYDSYLHTCSDAEIIDNIYENPELLAGDTND